MRGAAAAWGSPRFDVLEHPHDALADQLALALAESGELDAARRAVDELPAEAVARRHVRFLLGGWEKAAEEWQAALDDDLSAGDLRDAALNARWLAEARLAWVTSRLPRQRSTTLSTSRYRPLRCRRRSGDARGWLPWDRCLSPRRRIIWAGAARC